MVRILSWCIEVLGAMASGIQVKVRQGVILGSSLTVPILEASPIACTIDCGGPSEVVWRQKWGTLASAGGDLPPELRTLDYLKEAPG